MSGAAFGTGLSVCHAREIDTIDPMKVLHTLKGGGGGEYGDPGQINIANA